MRKVPAAFCGRDFFCRDCRYGLLRNSSVWQNCLCRLKPKFCLVVYFHRKVGLGAESAFPAVGQPDFDFPAVLFHGPDTGHMGKVLADEGLDGFGNQRCRKRFLPLADFLPSAVPLELDDGAVFELHLVFRFHAIHFFLAAEPDSGRVIGLEEALGAAGQAVHRHGLVVFYAVGPDGGSA